MKPQLSISSGPMDAEELQGHLDTINTILEQPLTQAQFAELIGRHTNSVNNWLNDRATIPLSLAMLVRYVAEDLVALHINP